MTDAETKFLMARLAAIEVVVENLLADSLRFASDPVAMGHDFIERVEASAIKNHDPRLPAEMAETMLVAIANLVERAIGKVQKAAG